MKKLIIPLSLNLKNRWRITIPLYSPLHYSPFLYSPLLYSPLSLKTSKYSINSLTLVYVPTKDIAPLPKIFLRGSACKLRKRKMVRLANNKTAEEVGPTNDVSVEDTGPLSQPREIPKNPSTSTNLLQRRSVESVKKLGQLHWFSPCY